MKNLQIEIKRSETGRSGIVVSGQELPADYVEDLPSFDGTRQLKTFLVGYVVRHRPYEGQFEVDLTLNTLLSEFSPGTPDQPLSVRGIQFPGAAGYAVRHITKDLAEITLTLVTDRFSADLAAPTGTLLG